VDPRHTMHRVLTEASIDPTREGLDPDVFIEAEEGEFVLRPEHQRQLENIAAEVNENITPVYGVYIKGSILSKQWLPWSDADLLLIIDEDIDDDSWYDIFDLIRETYEGEDLKGTDHPIEIFPHRGEYNEDRADGIYDVTNEAWVKGPYDIAVDIEHYMPGFLIAAREFDLSMGELSRDVADFLIYQSLSDSEVSALADSIVAKLGEIDNEVGHLIDLGRSIKQARQDAFGANLTPDEVAQYGSRNNLPANVIQKLLERYNYMALYSALRDIRGRFGAEDSIDTPEEIELLRRRLGVLVGAPD